MYFSENLIICSTFTIMVALVMVPNVVDYRRKASKSKTTITFSDNDCSLE